MGKKFYQTESFKTLEKEWKAKLKESGFEDIEKSDGPSLIQPQIFSTNEQKYFRGLDYYDLCNQILRDFSFKKFVHRMIFELHAEGKSEREIQDVLSSEHKTSMSQKGINKVINRVRDQFVYGKKQ